MARKSRWATLNADAPIEIPAHALAGLYNRISVEDGDDEEQNSLGNQKKIALHYLSEQTGIKFVDSYSDNGYTGMNYNRPDFQRMMADLRSGRINCVIVKDISRLGRHFIQTSEYVERIFPEMGVRLICINDGYDSAAEGADALALTLPLKMVMNDFYVKDISRKIRSGINAKIGAGDYIPSASSIPYGYIRNPEDITFDIDPETAPIVRKIFELRAEGMSLNGIAAVLNKEGHPSPGKLRYLRGITMSSRYVNANWIRGTIRKMLCDQVYIGNRVHGRVQSDKYGQKKSRRGEEEWYVVEQAHPAIIPTELFEKVQEVAKTERRRLSEMDRHEGPDLDYRNLFRGKVFCAECGSTMTAGKGLGRPGSGISPWLFYDCNNYKYSSRLKCSSHYIRQEVIMDKVQNLLNQQLQISVDLDEMITSIQNRRATRAFVAEATDRHTSAVRKRKHMEGKMEELLLDLAQRKIGRHKYEYLREQYSQQLEKLIEEETKAFADRNALDAAVASARQWIEKLQQFKKIPELTPELVDSLVERIEVTADKGVRIILKYGNPYAGLDEFIKRTEAVRDAG